MAYFLATTIGLKIHYFEAALISYSLTYLSLCRSPCFLPIDRPRATVFPEKRFARDATRRRRRRR